MSTNPSSTNIALNGLSGTNMASTSNLLSPDLGQCIIGGNGSISNGVIVTTRIYNNYGFRTNNYCIIRNGTMNIPSGEMFYELVKTSDTNVIAFDEPNASGNRIDYIPNMVKSLVITTDTGDGSSSSLSSGAIVFIVLLILFFIVLLSTGGYYGHKYYKKWRGNRSRSHYDVGDEPTHSRYESASEGAPEEYHKVRY
jgi:hypothetical protein